MFSIVFSIPYSIFANGLSIEDQLMAENDEYNKEIEKTEKENDATIPQIDKYSFIPLVSKETDELEVFDTCLLYYDGCDFFKEEHGKFRTRLKCETTKESSCLLSKDEFEKKVSISENWNREEYLSFLIEKELKAFPYVNYHIEGFQEKLEKNKGLAIGCSIALIVLFIFYKIYNKLKRKKDDYLTYELDKQIYGDIGLEAIENKKNMEAIVKNSKVNKDKKDIFDV